MTSPFAVVANLTACFDLPSDTQIVNELGSPATAKTTQIAIAFAVPNKNKSVKDEYFQDGGMTRLPYKGFWVLPQKAPLNLAAEQVGECYLWRVNGLDGFSLPVQGFADVAAYEAFIEANLDKRAATGYFVLAKTPADAFGVADAAGDKFEGYLQVKTAWGDAI